MIRKLALSGLLRSGKDYVAQQGGFAVFSFAEPMYRICDYAFGFCDKSRKDHRRFLQQIGQIGWGYDDNDLPHDMNRAMLVMLLRKFGGPISGCQEIEWHNFGMDKEFWVKGLLARIKNAELTEDKPGRYAVVNCRFEHELEPLKKTGFSHFLVLCTERTRSIRYGGMIPESINEDPSEQFARKLARTLPDHQIIWNDDVPMPSGRSYLTVESFVRLGAVDLPLV